MYSFGVIDLHYEHSLDRYVCGLGIQHSRSMCLIDITSIYDICVSVVWTRHERMFLFGAEHWLNNIGLFHSICVKYIQF